MGERIRTLDWTPTPLGPIEFWPQTLKTAVGIMLGTHSPAAVYWGADLILLYNDPFRDMIGEKHPRAFGRSGREVFSEIWDDLAPMFDHVMSGQGATAAQDQLLPINRNGRIEDAWFDFSLNPIPCEDGSISGILNLPQETTKRVQAERALRESEERYRSLFENIDQGFCLIEVIFDASGKAVDYRFLEVNPAFEKQTGLVNAQGQTMRELAPEHEEHWFETYGQIALTGEPRRFEHRAEQLHRWYDVLAFPFGDPGKRQVAILFNDVTGLKNVEGELRKAKNEAEEASRAKSEFLANMSHEIRTPMTVFMAAIEHLLQIDRDPERRHLLGMADQSAKRLRSLIDDILDLSRIEARKITLEETPFDLLTCVREVVEMFILPARERNLRLEYEVAVEAPLKMVGDPDRLGQVLINLIGNAVKFTKEGAIRVCVQPRGPLLEFSVADTGIGIPEEKRAMIFDSFSQADASFTRSFGGSGLGLAISKGLVELMGGEISLKNRDGHGSVFSFTLPLKSMEQQSSVPAEDSLKEPGEPPAATRILLAEDEPMIGEMVAMVLAKRGCQVDIAGTGREAVEKWSSGNFNIVLMDLQMPEMDGLAATRSIREREAGGEPRTCIIGLTAHARREIRDECLNAGMNNVLTKPIQMQKLYSAIDDCPSE